jgi:cytochrome c peroxidase
MPGRSRRVTLMIAMAFVCGFVLPAIPLVFGQRPTTGNELEAWKAAFRRPASLPSPADNVPSPAKIALGQMLFGETKLSSNGRIACATCHNPELSFTDGVARSQAGATGVMLRRHSPSLWNNAWVPELFWDGRAASLELQASFPMSHPDEMASSPEAAAARLADDASYQARFAAAFPDAPAVNAENLLKALAAFQRTLVSPPTRFDTWIAGDASALSSEEIEGFRLFTGKGRCVNCHSGFAFTDEAFHDIGLPGDDKGRGPIVDLSAADHAFRTPSLRERVWTAPYMHDGSFASFEDVLRHYQTGGIRRPSRSRDMPEPFQFSDDERAALIAFLESLSSDRPPKPSREPWVGRPAPPASQVTVRGLRVSQIDKMFKPGAIELHRGETLTITNDDTRVHNVRIADPRLKFNSGAQDPGESVSLKLDQDGLFEAHCAIHPTMRLHIKVD